MLMRCLLASTALALAGAAMAQDIQPVADTATEAANDLRGVTFAADGKIYVSGHRGDVEAETTTVVGRFNADGTPDAASATTASSRSTSRPAGSSSRWR